MHNYSQAQIQEDWTTWSKQQKKLGIRFGQYFCNVHPDMHSNSKLFNEPDNRAALNYLLQNAQF